MELWEWIENNPERRLGKIRCWIRKIPLQCKEKYVSQDGYFHVVRASISWQKNNWTFRSSYHTMTFTTNHWERKRWDGCCCWSFSHSQTANPTISCLPPEHPWTNHITMSPWANGTLANGWARRRSRYLKRLRSIWFQLGEKRMSSHISHLYRYEKNSMGECVHSLWRGRDFVASRSSHRHF